METNGNGESGTAEAKEAGRSKLKALPLKAKLDIGAGCVLLAAGIGCGVAVAVQQPQQAVQPQEQERQAEAQVQKQRVAIKVDLGDWDASRATALIAHIAGEGVDFYTALDENGEAKIDLAPGDYEVEFVPSIGADGSLLKVAGKQKLAVADSGASISAKGEKAEAADVSKDEMASVVDQLAKANAAATASDGVSSSHGSSASTAQAAASTSNSSSGGSNSGGSSSASSSASPQPSQPAHTHSWVAVTEQRWHSNPVSVWVQDSAAWDESKPVYEWVEWCNTCNSQVPHSHVKDTMLAGNGHSVTSKQIQTGTTTVHHDATGHYETQDQGWYETITTGYQCSGCGAWQ